MRLRRISALVLAAAVATTMLTGCPWDKEEEPGSSSSSSSSSSSRPSYDDSDEDEDSEFDMDIFADSDLCVCLKQRIVPEIEAISGTFWEFAHFLC